MNASIAWLGLLNDVLSRGVEVAPRGKLTLEIPQHTIEVDMAYPVVCVPERKLSYQFMAAEAFWILTGDDSVAGIASFNSNISEFSDDGVRFFGAYGPKVVDQIPFVVSKLLSDVSTRQAVISIWREKPPVTKDVPCTVAIAFNARGGWLNAHVFMRSNDVWLGMPYDVFNFSMIAHLVCAKYNEAQSNPRALKPGRLYLTAASSHMYEPNWAESKRIYETTNSRQWPYGDGSSDNCWPVPSPMWMDSTHIIAVLKRLRTTKRGNELRWWERTS